jgi:hypothetical protein
MIRLIWSGGSGASILLVSRINFLLATFNGVCAKALEGTLARIHFCRKTSSGLPGLESSAARILRRYLSTISRILLR